MCLISRMAKYVAGYAHERSIINPREDRSDCSDWSALRADDYSLDY